MSWTRAFYYSYYNNIVYTLRVLRSNIIITNDLNRSNGRCKRTRTPDVQYNNNNNYDNITTTDVCLL